LFNTNVTKGPNNNLTVTFTRKLQATDKRDFSIDPQKAIKMIYAYGITDSGFAYHGQNRGYFSIEVNSNHSTYCLPITVDNREGNEIGFKSMDS
jgi:hypothetical protein